MSDSRLTLLQFLAAYAVALAVVGGLALGLHRARRSAEGRLHDQVETLARSQAALADSELHYRNLFDHSPMSHIRQ